jgi:hypothetical protein
VGSAGPQSAGPGATGPVGQQAGGPAGTGGGQNRPPTRTDAIVPGLYASVDPAVAPRGWTFTDTMTSRGVAEEHIETMVVAPSGAVGRVVRAYDVLTEDLILAEAFLDAIPSAERWLNISPPMVPGRGTPLETYLTIRCMKLFERGNGASFFGEDRKVHISTIINKKSVLQLGRARKLGTSLAQAVRTCHSTTYAANSIVQSGGRVAAVVFSLGQGRFVPAGNIVNDPQELAKYGLVATDLVPYFFDIDIDVEKA